MLCSSMVVHNTVEPQGRYGYSLWKVFGLGGARWEKECNYLVYLVLNFCP